MKNTTFDPNFVNISLNVTKFGMLKLKLTCHVILVAMETISAGNYEFLSYQNVGIYKLGCRSVNALARVLTCILLERASHQHCNKVCGICIAAI